MEIEVYSRNPDPAPPAPKFYVRVNGKVVVVTEDAEVARVMGAAFDTLSALKHIVNDTPIPGGDAMLTARGYNMACAAIARAEGRAT